MLAFAIFVCYLCLVSCQSYTSPTIMTSTGVIQGIRKYSADREIEVFLGVPYALPPIGERRFLPPSPLPPFNKPINATKKSLPCYQVSLPGSSTAPIRWVPKTTEFSEDCLYLNIWKPVCEFPDDGQIYLLPIMVWFHGGGFNTGSGNLDDYDGEILASYGDVIVISINYRLGAFGFINLGGQPVTGNMGLSDQEMALRWIRANAAAFGGDPERITLFGQSAGSAAIGLHMLSPASRSLFRRAIMQSWSPSSPIAVHSPATSLEIAVRFSKSIGCLDENEVLTSNVPGVLKCLQETPPEKLVVAETVLMIENLQMGNIFTFVPRYGDRVVPFHPVTALLSSARIKRGELLIGTTQDEGSLTLLFQSPQVAKQDFSFPVNSREEYEAAIAQVYRFLPRIYQQRIADFYSQGIVDGSASCYRQAIYDALGDPFFYCPTLQFANAVATKNRDLATYFYIFNHRSSNSKWPEWAGVAHYDDVPYIFGDPFRNPDEYTEKEQQFSAALMTIWVTFASTGQVPLEIWPKFTSQQQNYAEFNVNNATIGRVPRQEVCAFWASLFNEEDVRNIISTL